MFTVNLALRIYCNHRLDNTYDGRDIIRLPDRTQVYAGDYEQRLAGHTDTPDVSRTPDRTIRHG